MLEIPCTLIFQGDPLQVEKVERLIKEAKEKAKEKVETKVRAKEKVTSKIKGKYNHNQCHHLI